MVKPFRQAVSVSILRCSSFILNSLQFSIQQQHGHLLISKFCVSSCPYMASIATYQHPYSTCLHMQYQVSTLHPMNILNVPIPSSLFHFCPNLARLPHYAQLVGYSQSKFVLAACSHPGSVCLQLICLMVCYGQDKMACHLHPIPCTWDAVTTCTPVTVFFSLGVKDGRNSKHLLTSYLYFTMNSCSHMFSLSKISMETKKYFVSFTTMHNGKLWLHFFTF